MSTVILLAPPRSGASLVAAAMRADARWSSTSLSQAGAIDGVPGLSAPERGFGSHRLVAADCTPELAAKVAGLVAAEGPTVDWSPRLAMRASFLAEALPAARFIVVSRRPVPAIASMMQAWASGRFASEPELPGWWGDRWSLPLIEGWRGLIGAPLGRVCAAQWAAIASAINDDLAGVEPARWTVASYEGLLADPTAELERVCRALDLPWSARLDSPLALTPSAVTYPDPGGWQRCWPEIAAALPAIEPVIDEYRALLTSHRPDLPWPELEHQGAGAVAKETLPSAGTPFSSSHTESVARLLEAAESTLAITTYKSGHLILARSAGPKLNTEFTQFERPMGIAAAGSRLAIGTEDAIEVFSSHPALAQRVGGDVPTDTPYAPRSTTITGDIAIHDMAYGEGGQLFFVNTRFSCLCTMDPDYSFVPVWTPPWITGLSDDDRCHLNGLAMVDGAPRYVTALSMTDAPYGWREHKGTSGVIVDVATNDVIVNGLAMPHSPRWHDGRLWVLESGRGALCVIDLASRTVQEVAALPGFTRGLAFIGPYALVGLSQVRESVFANLPITSRADERNCGMWVVDTRTGEQAGWLRFDGVVQEIFEVAVLPFVWPTIVQDADLARNSFVLPEEILANLSSDR